MRLSDAEWRVMGALWDAPGDEGATARDIVEAVEAETDWAYTTVKTMLSRLAEKGAVGASRVGNTDHYRPLISRAEARRSALRSLMDRAFDGAIGPLVQCLVEEERLSEADRESIMRVIEGEPDARGDER